MKRLLAAVCGLASLLAGVGCHSTSSVVVEVGADDAVIDEAMVARADGRRVVVRFGPAVVADVNGDGVLRVRASNVEIACEGVLRGAEAGVAPDSFAGTAVRIEGQSGVTVKGLSVTGYKVGLRATDADGLVIDRANFDNLWRMHLKSTKEKEHNDDWLWPHENDKQEWVTRYGAAVCIERSRGVTVSNVRVRNGQNGIILDRISGSKLFDNDCSFLSGWGIAMWRSCDNVISRNALDFCVRGYSHGKYNRGQDSAGLLMFEQCSRNTVVENSITHCGDGVFVFAGKEALGEKMVEGRELDYTRLGCNDNRFEGNDLSFAAAHGLEATFSFGNWVTDNAFEGNAICGVWGGYSQESFIVGNRFVDNGLKGHGEGGGINIEHGCRNYIARNRLERNTFGVRLWNDDDGALLKTPWAKANHRGSEMEDIFQNTFVENDVHAWVDGTRGLLAGLNSLEPEGRCVSKGSQSYGWGMEIEDGEKGIVGCLTSVPTMRTVATPPQDDEVSERVERVPSGVAAGESRPVGKRDRLRGREWIRVGEWGPVEPAGAR